MRKFLVLFPLLTSCLTAEMVRRPGSGPAAFAPVNEGDYGEVRYSDGGGDSIREARRQDAYMQMYTVCGGVYRIISEERSGDFDLAGAILASPRYGGGTKVYRHIKFACGAAPTEM